MRVAVTVEAGMSVALSTINSQRPDLTRAEYTKEIEQRIRAVLEGYGNAVACHVSIELI